MSHSNHPVVLVTGASRGLGRAIAIELAQRGYRVALNYLADHASAEATLATLTELGGTGMLVPFDVADHAAVTAGVERIREAWGDIGALVNNAGIAIDAPFATSSSVDLQHIVGTNLLGTVHCCRAVVRQMMAQRGGSIVNVGSVAARRAGRGQTAYATTKGAIEAFTRNLAAELARYGIRVNAVVPGFIDAGIAARMDPRRLAHQKTLIPVGRLGTDQEVARVVAFLLSEDASYIVGHALVVDGGLSL